MQDRKLVMATDHSRGNVAVAPASEHVQMPSTFAVSSVCRALVARLVADEAIYNVVRRVERLRSSDAVKASVTGGFPADFCDIGSAQGIVAAAAARIAAPVSSVRRRRIATMVVDEAIARVVRRQHGLVTKSQPTEHVVAPNDAIEQSQDLRLDVEQAPAPPPQPPETTRGADVTGIDYPLLDIVSPPPTTEPEKPITSVPPASPEQSETISDTAVETVVPPVQEEPTPAVDEAIEKPCEPEIPVTTQSRPESSSAAQAWRYIKQGSRVAAAVFGFWLLAMICLIGVYRFINPPMTNLMISHAMMGTKVDQRWRSLNKISPNLVRAVVVSEDWRFCEHYGIDFKEIEAAIARSRNGIPRGASTMTMQVAKNLFLWPEKSYIRKALEVPLTWSLELLLSKRRIAEIYLNIVEWGPGIFGAEAAARHHFRKPASRLSRREAALLAVSLPNPRRRKAGKPGRGLRRMAGTIQARMRQVGTGVSCILKR